MRLRADNASVILSEDVKCAFYLQRTRLWSPRLLFQLSADCALISADLLAHFFFTRFDIGKSQTPANSLFRKVTHRLKAAAAPRAERLASARTEPSKAEPNTSPRFSTRGRDSPAVSVTAAEHPHACLPDGNSQPPTLRVRRTVSSPSPRKAQFKKNNNNNKRGREGGKPRNKTAPSRACANLQLVSPPRRHRSWLELKNPGAPLHRRGAILPRRWDSRCAPTGNECGK